MFSTLPTSLLNQVAPVFTRSGKSGRLSILIYHRVLPKDDPFLRDNLDAATFDQHMQLISRYFNVLPLSEAVERLKSKSLSSRSICITFDDGYRDNVDIALPILKKYNLPATFFIASGFLNGTCMWNDAIYESLRDTSEKFIDLAAVNLPKYSTSTLTERRTAAEQLIGHLKYFPYTKRLTAVNHISEVCQAILPTDLMMRDQHVKQLFDDGMEIGGHTMSHPILASLDPKEARSEIIDGKEYLENIIGQSLKLFAYPNGKPNQDYTAEHLNILKELNFSCAVSTAWGVSSYKSDMYQLPRFTPWDTNNTRFMMRLLHNCLRTSYETV